MPDRVSRFDPVEHVGAPYAIGSDTSKAAAKKVAGKSARDRADVYTFIVRAGEHGAIWDEIWEPLGLSPTSNGRITELRDAGSIYDCGRRRRTRSGSLATVWVASALRKVPEIADPVISNDEVAF